MTRPARVDGRDPTRVVTRRCVALLVDALLLAIVPILTIAVVGHAGKALLGIRVVPPEGSAAGPLRSLVRALAWVVGGIALVVPIALWSAWFTPGHRRVGDWLAGTYVIRSRDASANATTAGG